MHVWFSGDFAGQRQDRISLEYHRSLHEGISLGVTHEASRWQPRPTQISCAFCRSPSKISYHITQNGQWSHKICHACISRFRKYLLTVVPHPQSPPNAGAGRVDGAPNTGATGVLPAVLISEKVDWPLCSRLLCCGTPTATTSTSCVQRAFLAVHHQDPRSARAPQPSEVEGRFFASYDASFRQCPIDLRMLVHLRARVRPLPGPAVAISRRPGSGSGSGRS